MDTLEAIFTRRSVRSYTADPIPLDVLQKILAAARASPSDGNAQAWNFIIVQDLKQLAFLMSLAPGIIGNPRTVIMICQDDERTAQFSGRGG